MPIQKDKERDAPDDAPLAASRDAMQGVTKEDSPDETVEGGRYVVGGRTVNAEGEPVKGGTSSTKE